MKHYKILTAATAVALALSLNSCADMLWGVSADTGTGVTDDYSPYYGYYNNGIWDNALNGFYGPVWTAPPTYIPPRRPGWNGWNGGNPEPAIPPQSRPSNGANRPAFTPGNNQGNPEGVTGQPITPSTSPAGAQRPGNNGRPLPQ